MNTKRIITGLMVGGIWLWLLFSGVSWLFWLIFLLVGGLALGEYCTIILPGHPWTDKGAGIILGLLPLIAAFNGKPELVTAALFLALFLLIAYTLTRYQSLSRSQLNCAPFDLMLRLGFGIFYVGFSFSHFTLLLGLENGVQWLLLLTAITVASDSCAYYGGILFGRHKLAPAISPGKTIEGFIAGTLGAVVAAVLVGIPWLPFVPPLTMAILTLALTCIGVMGDLTESMLKRTMRIKDSGNILPGHGGVLDRMDSLMIAAPLLFYLIHFGIIPGH